MEKKSKGGITAERIEYRKRQYYLLLCDGGRAGSFGVLG